MRHLDGAVGDRIGGLQAGHDLAGGKDLDGELAVRGVLDAVGDLVGGAEDDVEVLGKRGGEAPGDRRAILRQRRGCKRQHGGCSGAGRGGLP